MKLSLTLPTLLVALDGTSASSARATSRHTDGRKNAPAKKLVRNARRVQQNSYGYNNGGSYGGYYGGGAQGGDEDTEEAWYLADYSLKMISCIQGEQSINYERGEVESSTVIFRLCPRETCGADNSTSVPCEEGYGDFAVGINTFAEAYVESIKDNYNGDSQYYSYQYGEFNVEEYVKECRLFDGEGENGGNNQNYYNNYGATYAYIGAACTSDGTDIKLASFSDPYCSTESDVSFEDTHNGYTLPYSNGGLVPNTCMSCLSMNGNYEMEVSEMCQEMYEDANYKCEQNMESFNTYYGPDTSGCEYLESKVPTSSKKSSSSSGSSKSGNLFQNQPESVKLAEEYLALLIVSALLGAGFVVFFVQKTVAKNATEKEGTEPKEPSPITESIKSAAMLVKMTALETAAKIAPIVREIAAKITSVVRGISSTEPQDDYSNMEDDEKKQAGPEEEHC